LFSVGIDADTGTGTGTDKKFFTPSPTALEIFFHCQQERLKVQNCEFQL
jgi:hypothetical protein